MYCTECGIILSDNAKFCSFCGSKVSISKEVITPEEKKFDRDRYTIESIGDVSILGIGVYSFYLIQHHLIYHNASINLAYVTILSIFSLFCVLVVTKRYHRRANMRKQYYNHILSNPIYLVFFALMFFLLLVWYFSPLARYWGIFSQFL